MQVEIGSNARSANHGSIATVLGLARIRIRDCTFARIALRRRQAKTSWSRLVVISPLMRCMRGPVNREPAALQQAEIMYIMCISTTGREFL